MSIRPVKRLIKAKPTMEGAGVHLRRAFGFGNTSDFDPFLLLDDFRNDVPEDYLAGFPWHPHRGIETITYVLAGDRRARRQPGQPRRDRRGRHPVDDRGQRHHSPGDAARATRPGRMHGFQLWANLPAALKMTAPRYQEVKARRDSRGDRRRRHARARGLRQLLGQDRARRRDRRRAELPRRLRAAGQAQDAARRDDAPRVRLRLRGRRASSATRRARWRCRPKASGWPDTTPPAEADNRSLVLFDRGDEVTVQAGEDGIRFLLVSGKPLREPVAWYGPIVMNTQEQLRQAFEELDAARSSKYDERDNTTGDLIDLTSPDVS